MDIILPGPLKRVSRQRIGKLPALAGLLHCPNLEGFHLLDCIVPLPQERKALLQHLVPVPTPSNNPHHAKTASKDEGHLTGA
jgi:hypothetical protein